MTVPPWLVKVLDVHLPDETGGKRDEIAASIMLNLEEVAFSKLVSVVRLAMVAELGHAIKHKEATNVTLAIVTALEKL